MEAYIYCILGGQAKTKQSIYGSRALSLKTQQVFRQLVEDSIINYDTGTWINNMNRPISPSLWLLTSNLIILKNSIQGYNSKLKTATENMVFGVNNGLNYDKLWV